MTHHVALLRFDVRDTGIQIARSSPTEIYSGSRARSLPKKQSRRVLSRRKSKLDIAGRKCDAGQTVPLAFFSRRTRCVRGPFPSSPPSSLSPPCVCVCVCFCPKRSRVACLEDSPERMTNQWFDSPLAFILLIHNLT